jgi:hypothetical protein
MSISSRIHSRIRSEIRTISAAFVVASIAFVPTRAHAQEASEANGAKSTKDGWYRLAVMGQLGFGTPYGDLGVALDWAPVSWWVLSAGGGANTHGAQWALMTRFRAPHAGAGLGLGVSGGPFGTCGTFCVGGGDDRYHWSHAWWLNVEAGLESDARESYRIRGYIGMGVLLNTAAGSCQPGNASSNGRPDCPTSISPGLYVGVSFGGGVLR